MLPTVRYIQCLLFVCWFINYSRSWELAGNILLPCRCWNRAQSPSQWEATSMCWLLFSEGRYFRPPLVPVPSLSLSLPHSFSWIQTLWQDSPMHCNVLELSAKCRETLGLSFRLYTGSVILGSWRLVPRTPEESSPSSSCKPLASKWSCNT